MSVIFPETPKSTKSGPIEVKDPLAQMVWKRLQGARANRHQVDMQWPTWERYYLGHHFNKPRAPWKGRYPKNFIFNTVETTLPIMTDSVPQITVVPFESDDTKIADILGNVVRRVWMDQDMDLKLPEILKNTLILGTGFAKVWWNPELGGGRGDIAISVVNPYHLFPSPGATSIKDASYVIFAANVPLSQVAGIYPEVMDFVKSGQLVLGPWDESLTVKKPILSDDIDSYNYTNTSVSYQGSTTNFQKIPRVGTADFDPREEIVTLVEMWDKNDQGLPQVSVVVNGVPLRRAFRPFRHTGFPFVRFIDYPLPGEFWGMGEVQQLRPMQDLINERANQIHDILNLTANPQFVSDSNAGINKKAFINRPGVWLQKQPGTEARWNPPPPIPSGLFEAQQIEKTDFDTISGVHDVTQGRRPVGVEAAAAIVELQEAAQTRIREKTRFMEGSLREMGRQIISLIQQFYTDERVIRVVGTKSAQPEFIQVNKVQPSPDGGIERLNDLSVGHFDLEIGVGSTLPVSKTRRSALMIQLFQLGIVDDRAVLETTGMSPEEIETIISRKNQQQQALLQAQLGGEAGGPQVSAETASTLPSEDELRAIEENQAQIQLGA